jgi:hypothetical protein
MKIESRRMVRRPAGCLLIDPFEPNLVESEFIDKNIDHPNRIVLMEPVFQAFRKQRALPAIIPSTNRFIRSSVDDERIIRCESHQTAAFSHSQGQKRKDSN